MNVTFTPDQKEPIFITSLSLTASGAGCGIEIVGIGRDEAVMGMRACLGVSMCGS